jgi:hypothetical protein
MSSREIARMMGAGRALFGAGFLVNPRGSMRPWIGDDADRPPVMLLTRAFGIRDLVIGAGALASLDDPKALRTWLVAGLASDATDLAVTYAAADEIPGWGRAMVMAVAGGAVAMGVAALAASGDSQP